MLHVVRNESAAIPHWASGGQAITWPDLQTRLLRLDPTLRVASRTLEYLLAERILRPSLPATLTEFSSRDTAQRRWIESAYERLCSLIADASNEPPWLADAANELVKQLAYIGFVARASVSHRLALLVCDVEPPFLLATIGSTRLHAASDLPWTRVDLDLWASLGRRLSVMGGGVTASVFALDLPLDALSNRTPFDRFSDLYTEIVGEPPHSELVAARFGDLTFADQRGEQEGIDIVRATTKQSWREQIVYAVNHALAQGYAPEEIAVVYASAESASAAGSVLEAHALPVWVSGLREPSVVLEKLHGILDAVDTPEGLADLSDALATTDVPTLPSAVEKPRHALAERMHLRAIAREQNAQREAEACLAEAREAIGLIGSSTLPLDSIAGALRATLAHAARAAVGSRVSAIHISPLGMVGHAKVVVVIDAQRDQFPPQAASLGGGHVAQRRQVIEEATRWATVMRALGSAEALTFIFSMQGDDGTAAEPSRVLGWLERHRTPVRVAMAAPVRSLPRGDRRVARERSRAASFFSEALAEVPNDPVRWTSRVARATGASPLTPMRVTFLEPTLECAFAGFASAVLRARRRDDAHPDPDPREIGRLQHAALEAAFVATRHAWRTRPRDGEHIMATGMAAARRLLMKELGPESPVMIDRIAEDCEALIRESVNDLDWDFALAEQPFDGRIWAPHVLGEGDDKVHLSGRIDRIDTHHTEARLRIVDYKGSTSGAEAARRKPLQLLVYANVAKRELGIADAEGLYWPVRTRKALDKRGINLNEDAWLTKALDATLSLRRHLPLANGAPAVCDTCNYDVACRKPRYVVTGLIDDASES